MRVRKMGEDPNNCPAPEAAPLATGHGNRNGCYCNNKRTHLEAPWDGHHEDLETVRSTQRNKKKRPRTHISYDETPTRSDIKSRLGPKRWSSIKERLGTPSIKMRLGQRRENPLNQWEQTSPWEPWAPGMEPKCNTEWNIQIRECMSHFFGAQEAENDPTDDEIGTVDSSNDEKDEKEN